MPDSSESNNPGLDLADNMLTKYEQQSASMFSLVKTLLSTSTMPHIILIVLFSAILYTVARIDSVTDFAAMAFTSLSAGYLITALLAKHKTVNNWITLNDEIPLDETSLILRIIYRFRICLFPLISAGVIFLLLIFTTGKDGMIPDANKSIPLILGMLFIVWSIVQGTSFSHWSSTTCAKKSSDAKKLVSMKSSIIILFITISSVSILLACLFYQLGDINNSLSESLLKSIPFTILALGATIGSLSYSWNYKKLSSMKPRLQKFSNRWTTICHLFVTWHLLTIWRQNFMEPSVIQVFIEEIVLMIFTVFVAIWSMTSKGYKSKFKLITEENALPWGLTFGYAYAGSVAMLTTFFDDIKIVMSIGHSVVIITVFFAHKLVLRNLIDKDNITVEVSRIVGNSEPSTAPKHDDIEIVQTKFGSAAETKPKSEEVWQEDDDVDWNKAQQQVQIDNIEWDEAIELD